VVVQDAHVMLTLMMKFAGGTLFQRNELNVQEFLKQADLYEEVDASLLNRLYKMMLVTAVNHPLTIVRAREILNWSDSREYRDIFEGTYSREKGTAEDLSRDSAVNNDPAPLTYTENGLIRCPHCNREQTNRRFCSLCGGAIS
jgi:hypothetical protein